VLYSPPLPASIRPSAPFAVSSARGRLWPLAALVLLALLLLGCNEHLAGTHDVELVYRVADGSSPRDAALAIKERLAAAQVYADVRPVEGSPDRVRLLLDDAARDSARDLLAWRGGLTLYRIDPAAGDRSYQGTLAEAAQRAARATPPPAHLVVLERTGDDSAEVRVVFATPVLDLMDKIVGVRSSGKHVEVQLTPEGAVAFAAHEAELSRGELLVTRARAAYPIALDPGASAGTEDDRVVLDFAGQLPAYARAHATSRLLSTKVLPPLVFVEDTRAPVDRWLAAGCLVVPFVLSAIWLLFVRRFDRAHPEPWWLVGSTFLLGCVSCLPAGLLEYGCMLTSPWLNPTYATLGGRMSALPLAILVFTVVVGLSEEGVKLLATLAFAVRRREFDEPVDGIVYGAAAALGFAAVENVKYFAVGRLTAALIVARTFMSIPAHLLFSAIWGYALGARLVGRRHVWAWWLLAAVLHGTFDACLSVDGGLGLALLVEIAAAAAFVALLRRALRYGPRPHVTAGTERTYLRVGSKLRFALATAGFVVSIFPLAALAGALETASPRTAMPLLVLGAALVVLCGLAARAVSATVPLDVVTDEAGVTFAGAFRAWDRVSAIGPDPGSRHYLALASADGALSLGPFSADTRARFLAEVNRWTSARART
jgi:RsiW-degrading membrane proteinase PrsW (M82 family)